MAASTAPTEYSRKAKRGVAVAIGSDSPRRSLFPGAPVFAAGPPPLLPAARRTVRSRYVLRPREDGRPRGISAVPSRRGDRRGISAPAHSSSKSTPLQRAVEKRCLKRKSGREG